MPLMIHHSVSAAAAALVCAGALVGCSGSGAVTTVTQYAQAPAAPAAPAAMTGPAASRRVAANIGTAAAVVRRAHELPATRAAALPLVGKIVGIDPGHNGRNYTDPSYIDHLIWNGREYETCNTTGTETDSGYTEAQFNFNVATYLAADLRAEGAKVVLTRHSNTGIGPCVNQRAEIIDHSGANVAIDIHADGGPPDGRGFAILEPVADGPNDRIIGASERFGRDVLERYAALTGMPTSNYDGTGGIVFRDDLAGLNLTTVPEVLIETGNMRNPTDAALLITARFQHLAAAGLSQAITLFLTGRT
jgi:N-acetylmuramoyl-L-alanine amidase